ncbi:MAG: hypothetical protein K8S16_03065 [Bacteroidales bacterium]|nr:hypothetical protein [Bacteroidales bacterium]
MKKRPNVLVCPLDWGIGHATRCVPIIHELINQNTNVILGASNRPQAFLIKEFPDLQFIDFPNYNISYPSGNQGMVLKMMKQLPQFLKSIRKEFLFLKTIIEEHNINMVISDNRYGLYSNKIPSVFITHQVFIKTPEKIKFLEPSMLRFNNKYMKKYTECWIPDHKNEPNLSGMLSHKKPLPENTFFIGPLSRFKKDKKTRKENFKYDLLVMLSGPEPQRTNLENKVIDQLQTLDVKSVMVCGKPEVLKEKTKIKNIHIFPHLESDRLQQLIMDSEIILSRPGYSTIMDLAALGKKAIFIPTPGQTEQEYLAAYFEKKKIFHSVRQKDLNIKKALDEAGQFTGIFYPNDFGILKERIAVLLKHTQQTI